MPKTKVRCGEGYEDDATRCAKGPIMNKEKKWYRVTYDGGWFKEDSIEDIIKTITRPGNVYKGRIKRIIEVTERDIDISEIINMKD